MIKKLILLYPKFDSTFFLAQGLKCYDCVDCAEDQDGKPHECPEEDVTHCVKAVISVAPMFTIRGCVNPRVYPDITNGCQEIKLPTGEMIRLVACDSDLCNTGPVASSC